MRIVVNGISVFVDILMPPKLNNSSLQTVPVFIAVPGGPGFGHRVFRPELDALAAYFPVIYYDPRGTGASEVGAVEDWSLQQYAEDLAALCKELNVLRPVFYSHSAGAVVVAKTLAMYPGLATAAVFSAPSIFDTAFYARNLGLVGGERVASVAQRLWLEKDLSVAADYLREVMPLYDPVPKPADYWPKLEVNAELFLALADEVFSFDFAEALNTSLVDKLIMLGCHDPVVPSEQALQTLRATLSGKVQYVLLHHSGHDNLLSEPEKTVAVLAEFAASLNG